MACQVCGRPLKQKPRRGRPSKYCSKRCCDIRAAETSPSKQRSAECANCGQPFVGWPSKYCSDACRRWRSEFKNEPRTCIQCGAAFLPKTKVQQYCGNECAKSRQKKWHTCEVCSKRFAQGAGTSAHRCCSRACGFELQSRERGAISDAFHTTADYDDWTHIWFKACAICGTQFGFNNQQSQYCSSECQKENASRKEKRRREQRHVDKIVNCAECGSVYVVKYGSKRRRFCSDKCKKKTAVRVGHARRRAIDRGAFADHFNPLDVLERDGWRCHICKRSTPRKLRGTAHDRAPELDHILPLARGGMHILDNVACACRKCNLLKSDKPLGQMRLETGRVVFSS